MAIIWSSQWLQPRRVVSAGGLFAASGVGALVSIYALRSNNLTMVKLRQQVYDADKADGDVTAALGKLQQYVSRHMNTDLTPGKNAVYPPIQLRYTYERQKAALSQPISNDQLYSDAQQYCEAQNPTDFSGRNRVPCIQQYVSTHGSATTTQEVPDSLYKYDFLSPSWSPDFAGWSLVVTTLLVLASAVVWLRGKLAGKLAGRFKRA